MGDGGAAASFYFAGAAVAVVDPFARRQAIAGAGVNELGRKFPDFAAGADAVAKAILANDAGHFTFQVRIWKRVTAGAVSERVEFSNLRPLLLVNDDFPSRHARDSTPTKTGCQQVDGVGEILRKTRALPMSKAAIGCQRCK